MEEAKPVVLTKPVRGREMQSKKGPLDKLAPIGVEPEKIDKKRVETYYEGYVDGQLFLVPDSNLEAMKDMINFKMRPKTSIRYKHQTSYDIQYYDQFTEKLNELLSKMDDFQVSGDFERPESMKVEGSGDESPEDWNVDRVKGKIKSEPAGEAAKDVKSKDKIKNDTSDETIKSKIEQVKSDIVSELEKKYILDDNSLSSSSTSLQSRKSSNETEREIKSEFYEETEVDTEENELRVRFLISGHFKDGETPIYIVQEHNVKNDIFKDQKLDFKSYQENNNIDVFIAGKLYSENILGESQGKPAFLNTKPNKIIIDEEKSKIFNDSFEHIFEKEGTCILLQGKFIKDVTGKITPSLSFHVIGASVSSDNQ